MYTSYKMTKTNDKTLVYTEVDFNLDQSFQNPRELTNLVEEVLRAHDYVEKEGFSFIVGHCDTGVVLSFYRRETPEEKADREAFDARFNLT